MIESRCGIVCSNCEYREQMGCKGCVAIQQPFWGSCQVKQCCESKDKEHCGSCGTFPCDTIHKFSYDKEQGDEGRRIEQCKEWSRQV